MGHGRKRILHVSSAHRVSDGRIARREAGTLSDAGFDVTVLGLKGAEGVTLPSGPGYVEYAAPSSRLRRFMVRLPWLIGYCLKHRYDLYHLHDPDLIVLGFVLKLCGRKVVYDVHESYPMVILDRDWIPRLLRPMLSCAWRRLEAAFVRQADLTVAAHEPVRQQFPNGNVATVHNYPILQDFVAVKPQPMAARPQRVIYHGDLTEQRGLLTMVGAIARVDPALEATLRLGGSLASPLQDRIAGMPGMRRTSYLGWLDKDRLAEELGMARVGLVLLHPTHNYRIIRPNKLYEYMAASLPVIVSDFSHWREVVVSAQCGLLVDPLDSAKIAQAIEYLLTHPEEAAAMGARGRRAVQERYNWQAERHALVNAYDALFGETIEVRQRRSA